MTEPIDLDLLHYELQKVFRMKVGSLAENTTIWPVEPGRKFPYYGQILEVKEIKWFPGFAFPMLWFVEGPFGGTHPFHPYLNGGLCASCFREVQGPLDVKELLKELCQ